MTDRDRMLASVRNAELHNKVYDIFTLPKSKLKTKVKVEDFPLSGPERFRLSKSMSVTELMEATKFHEDEEAKPVRRWKEITHLFQVTRAPQFLKKSMENALWHYVYNGVSATHFSNSIIDEFGFPAEMRDDMDAHLKWLYWSFDGGTDNLADWRTILATFRIIIFFRLVQKKPIELLVSCFDIYAVGGKDAKAHPNESWYVEDAFQAVTNIFSLPGATLGEVSYLRNKIREAFLVLYQVPKPFHETHVFGKHVMYRGEFRKFCRSHDFLVGKFQEICWQRVPVELRLVYFDEEQSHAQNRADVVLYRFKLMQAYAMYQRSLSRGSFVTWKEAAKRNALVSRFAAQRFHRKRRGFFRFWRSDVAKLLLRRRRKLLAEVMGNYALKSRTFGRIRIFNYQTRYIFRTVGRFNPNAKNEKLAFMHLRNFVRLGLCRRALHRWWHETMYMINWDLSVEHDLARRLRPIMVKWQYSAHYDAMNKRVEFLALENKMAFDRMMLAADVEAVELVRIEKEKQERDRIAVEAAEEIRKAQLVQEAKIRKERAKMEERVVILASQREVRRKRVKAQMTKLKAQFVVSAARRYKEHIERSKRRITAYVDDPGNKLAIDMRFERLKREFLEPPNSDNRERERILTSHKNIVFLYLDAKLRNDGLDMTKVIFKFDKAKRGYLTYDEFKAMIKALGVKLNPAQIQAVIKGVDADGDGAIDLKELEESMKDIKLMGQEGSPWKMYVDAAQDVICYHNFDTGEKFFDYQIKDETLRIINISNMYGEAETEAKTHAAELKAKDWEEHVQNYMAKRMQWMYKMWKLRKRRRAKLWGMQSQMDANRRKIAQKIVIHCERLWIGAKCRIKFRRQLQLTYQKVYSVESPKGPDDQSHGRMFWFNHQTKQATWDRPHVLWRYGDVPLPSPWIPIDVPIPLPELSDDEKAAAFGVDQKGNMLPDNREQLFSLHYWHVLAKRDLPRKPDGIPVCLSCNRNLADMRCVQCTTNFCFACYRETHASPYGFLQQARPTPAQTNDLG